VQYAFSKQWSDLRNAAVRTRNTASLGDVAIFVNMDSATLWVHPDLFELDEDLQPVRIAGVPPDYFSPTGQRWAIHLPLGLCLRRGDSTGGSSASAAPVSCTTWCARPLPRVEAYWSIPADEETAVNGEWVKAPGRELFQCPGGGAGTACRWLLRILESSLPRWTRCGSRCTCRG